MARRAAFPGQSRNGGRVSQTRERVPTGTRITGTLPLTGSAAAAVRILASAAGSILLTGSAVAAVVAAGAANASATGTLPLSGAASGTVRVAAQAAGTVPLTGTGTAAVAIRASATGDLALTGAASGSVGAASGANTITAISGPAANSVTQRATTTGGEADKGTGSVALTVTLSADTTSIDYRVLRAEDDTVLKDWTAATASSLLAGSRTVTCGAVPARQGWLKIQLRSNASTTVQTFANTIGVGRVIAMSGQSLAVRMFGKMDSQTTTLTDLGITPGPNGIVYATYTDSQRSDSTATWEFPTDSGNYDSAGAATLLNDQVAHFGVTCALVGHSRGSTSISVYVPGGSESTALRAILSAVGGFEQFIWFQGHTDSTGAMSHLTYRTHLTNLFADMTSYNAVRGSSYDRILCAMPNCSSTSWGTNEQIAGIRQAQVDWLRTNAGTYVQPSDVALIDTVHQSQAGAVALARAFSRATKAQVNPTITAATRISTLEIRLDVSLPSGATALSGVGSPATRFRVFATGLTATALTLDSTTPITIGTNTITLKLASDPGASQALDVWFAPSPDPADNGATDMIYDNTSDGWTVGRQLQATTRAVTAPALSPAATPSVTLTMTSPTYEAAPTGFGQRITGGYGLTASATDNLPATATWTLEARFTLSAVPGATRIICGQNNKAYIGVHSSGRLLGNVRSNGSGDLWCGTTTTSVEGSNPNVADGLEHHVALVCTPQSRRLYLDGVLVAAGAPGTGSTTGVHKRSEGTNGLAVNSFGNTPGTFVWTGKSDEHAVWNIEKYISNFTPPTVPYVGTEAGLRGLWHLDGNGNPGI